MIDRTTSTIERDRETEMTMIMMTMVVEKEEEMTAMEMVEAIIEDRDIENHFV